MAMLVVAACGKPAGEITATVRLAPGPSNHAADTRFLSIGLDVSYVLGSRDWVEGEEQPRAVDALNLQQPRLRALTAALAPAYLKVGGADADRVFFTEDDEAVVPQPYQLKLTGTRWDELADFSRATALPLVFTLNAGPGPRVHGGWTPDNAALLVQHAAARGDPVAVWALGHEPNGYQATFGPSFRLTGAQYAKDFAAARAMLDANAPGAKLAGAQSSWWPVLGEPAPMMKDFMDKTTVTPDVVTWGWYPLESRRCQLQLTHATEHALDSTDALAGLDDAATVVERLQQVDAHGQPLWLADTGHARCGGEPGLSDRFVASLWWLDELGRLAARGQQVVVRQGLVGGENGLLDQATLEPNPDYWASVLFKQLMSGEVVDAHSDNARLLAYAQCTRGALASVTLLVINPDPVRPAAVTVDQVSTPHFLVFEVTAPDVLGRAVLLNARPLQANTDGRLPALTGVQVDSAGGTVSLHLNPRSYAFLVLPDTRTDEQRLCH